MIKAPKWKQISDTAHARLTRDREAIQNWWRNVQADPERRTNLFVLYGSYLLTAIAIVGLLWLSGIFDWRGSNGRTGLTLNFDCGDKTAEYKACKEAINDSDQITALLDLQPRYDPQDTLDFDVGIAVPGNAQPFPVLTKPTGIQVISSRAFNPLAYHAPKDERVTPIGGLWYSTLIRPATSFGISFAHTVLLQYSGLSERDFSIDFNLTIGGGMMLHGKKTMTLTLLPPVGFDVAEAAPPAERSSGGEAWTMRLESDNGEFMFRARLRNPATAPLDHLSELVLVAFLGVAGGGIVLAYVNLWVIRGRRKSGT